jgi:gamma-glutamyltranspeptidase/glutathione hydrolase
MSPLIIFDTKGNFLMTIGSPGGKAIISYISRILIDYFYFEKKIKESIEDSNYLRIYGKTFVEDEKLKASINGEVQVRSLTSGIGIIIKKSEGLIGYADHRRDGTVRGN